VSRIGASALAVVLAGILSLAAHTEVTLLVAAVVVVVQVMLAAAPAPADERGRAVPTPRFAVALTAGLVSTAFAARPSLLLGADGSRAGDEGLVSNGVLAGILLGVAAGLFVTLVAQMLRKDGRRDLVVSAGYATSLAMFAALVSSWVGAARAASGPDVVTISAAALAAALLVWPLPIDRFVCAALCVVVGSGVGAATALIVDGFPTWFFGVAVGAGVALFGVLGQVLGRAWSRGRSHVTSTGWGFPAAMAVALAGPIAYLGGQLVTASF
jgi:hypothetical protein